MASAHSSSVEYDPGLNIGHHLNAETPTKCISKNQSSDTEDDNNNDSRSGGTYALRQGPGIIFGSTDAEGEEKWMRYEGRRA